MKSILKGNGSILSAFGELLTDSHAAKMFKSGARTLFSSNSNLERNLSSTLYHSARWGNKRAASLSELATERGSDELKKRAAELTKRAAEDSAFSRLAYQASKKPNSKLVTANARQVGFANMLESAGDWLIAGNHIGSPDRWKNIAARAGVTAAGVGVASRLMSGGTLTHDKEGRFNVAGLPFI